METIKTAIFSYILLLTIFCTLPAHSAYYTSSEAYNPVQLKKTHLHFFVHDTLSGANPTAVRIAGPNATEYNPTPFGALLAMDDPLTEGPEITSEVVGNAQGMYISSSQDDINVSLVLYADFGFTTGKFKGSSLSVFSRNPVTESPREMAVVGGRGQFRRATGTVWVTTYSMDVTTGDAVLEYNVEVVHPLLGLGFVESVV
ncbi:Disease resistance-responsive family protein [Perilla frutescens var. hirtella]|uniref:Dirigent protein n=1 Tax=Perilla frutescens var. hirtella TaxID=608512 RepID=A0AAD4PAB8_PERFH|nr:Disease resistance-responsive family protein [Perilla frutescens var. hirtella]